MEEIGAPFTISSSSRLTSIDFAAYWFYGNNQLTINLETDASGLPSGTIIESFSYTGISYPPPAIYTVYSSIHPILESSQEYWIVLTAQDLAATGMAWQDNDQGTFGEAANSLYYTNYEWVYHPEAPTPAFDINGTTVPEPCTILFLVPGLAGFGAFRKIFKEAWPCGEGR